MSVDVEDWFQVQAFAGCIQRADWEGLPRRVEANMDRILSRFGQAGVHATFFTLGWIAERHPGIVRRIVADGHELASHGYGHARVDSQDPAAFGADVGHAKQVLEDLGGVPVVGYRAPTFSIGPRNPWAFDVLAEQGYRYSSSVYPVRHDLYGAPDSPRFPYQPGPAGLWELPMTTLPVAGRNIPISGGGYFRLMPYALYRQALRRYERGSGRPADATARPAARRSSATSSSSPTIVSSSSGSRCAVPMAALDRRDGPPARPWGRLPAAGQSNRPVPIPSAMSSSD